MMTLTDGAEVFVSFVSSDSPVIYKATVLVAEHKILQRSWGVQALMDFESVHATEAEALAACAADLRERARVLDAKADELAAKATACGVGPAKPE